MFLSSGNNAKHEYMIERYDDEIELKSHLSFLAGAKVASGVIDQWKRGNHLAGLIGLSSAVMYFTSGSLTALWGLSYRYAWVYTFYEKRLARQLMQLTTKQAIRLSAMAMRLLLYRFFGILGFIATIVELFYDWFSDNEIQVWLNYSALGKNKTALKFKTSFDQRTAFKAIELLSAMNGNDESKMLEQKTGEPQTDDKPLLHHTEIMVQAENYVAQWLLQAKVVTD